MFDSGILFSAVLNGLTTGAVYALVALGLTLIYGVLHIINFAHGDVMMVGVYAGYATAAETNQRFRYLIDHGQTGLSTAFDMPSLMGHDSDHPKSLGEVGREGVAVDTLDDMQTLFEGIDVGEVSVSMTINAPAAIMLAFYVVAAERQGIAPDRLRGTIQADILKEYIAQKEWCFPIDPAMRLLGDMVEWCTTDMPRWHPVSISGYHIREAGSTAAQELAFTLKDGFTYVERGIARGSSARGCSGQQEHRKEDGLRKSRHSRSLRLRLRARSGCRCCDRSS